MSFNTSRTKNQMRIRRQSFKFKNNSNGLMLSIHNTITDNDGQVKRIRFCHFCFEKSNDKCIAVDGRGSIFVFDLHHTKFWILNDEINNCSVVKFIPARKNQAIFGTKAGEIVILDIATGVIYHKEKIFINKVIGISFPEVNSSVFLATTSTDAIIFDLNDLVKKHKLEYTDLNLFICKLSFIPNSDKIYGCFNNDAIHIWENCNFKLLKRIYPLKLQEKFLKKEKPIELDLTDIIELNVDGVDNHMNLLKDYSKGVFNSVCFSNLANFMCITTQNHYLMLLTTINYDIVKLIYLKNYQLILTIKFLSNLTYPNKILVTLLTAKRNIILIDLNELDVKCIIQRENTYKMFGSRNGNMLAILLQTGELLIYNLNILIRKMNNEKENLKIIKDTNPDAMDDKRMEALNIEIRKSLSRQRLTNILKEYGEYPTKYRTMIWKAILELPQNTIFMELLKKDLHPCTEDYDKLYPIRDVSALRNLKRIVSCLAHWCKIFSQSTFIATFVFPFVNLFGTNLQLCFETIATILLNQCQLWFEFAPLEPINYLGMIENILNYFDPNLLKFYRQHKCTSKIYAWKLMKSGFTEQFDDKQWYKLWDHIISSDSTFLLFVIVSYQICNRSTIMRLVNHNEIENFFDDQVTIDVQRIIQTAYEIMETCPGHLHPKTYMKPFEHLTMGSYQKFLNYPKTLVNITARETNKLIEENKQLNEKFYELEKMEMLQAKYLENAVVNEEHQKRIQNVERIYQDVLVREEERVAFQRKQLIAYQRELRQREAAILHEKRNSVKRRKLVRRENELHNLMNKIERNRVREDTNLLMAEEELKEMDNLLNKFEYENNDDLKQLNIPSNQSKRERSEFKKQKSSRNNRNTDFDLKIKTIENMLQQNQKELQRLSKRKESEDNRKIRELKERILFLEKEVAQLLK